MKASSKILVAALVGSALNLGALAGPGIQYWQNRGASNPAADVAAAKPADSAGIVKCATMTVIPEKITRDNKLPAVVTCTPEMMRDNPRCKAACGM